MEAAPTLSPTQAKFVFQLLDELKPYLTPQGGFGSFESRLLEGFLLAQQSEGELTQSEVAQMAGIPQGSMSMLLRRLSEHGNNRRDGLGLLEFRIDPRDGRQRVWKLTGRGREAARKLARFLEDRGIT